MSEPDDLQEDSYDELAVARGVGSNSSSAVGTSGDEYVHTSASNGNRLRVSLAQFPPHLHNAISDLLPNWESVTSGGSGGSNFHAITYINSLFPTEQSLVDMDSALHRLKLKIARIDEEIVVAVREQSRNGAKGKQDLAEAKLAINDLFGKINEISSKASASESMVDDICGDIKSLDYAKRNLTVSITALKRLQMLVTAVDQLEEMTAKRQYQQVSKLLDAVTQLLLHFEQHRHMSKIAQLTDQVALLRDRLREQIFAEFSKQLDPRQGSSTPPANLAYSCLVVDALGPDVRKKFMSWFCEAQLAEYQLEFANNKDAARLENGEKRFNYLRALLRHYDTHWAAIFPRTWYMASLLGEEFSYLTRIALNETLESTKATLDVGVLVRVLSKCIDFEKELIARFAQDAEQVALMRQQEAKDEERVDQPQQRPSDSDPSDSSRPTDDYSASALRARNTKLQQELPSYAKFQGIMSSVFEPFLDLYIKQEDRAMQDLLDKLLSDETWLPSDDPSVETKVLQSSMSLLHYFKKSMRRCSALSCSQPLYDLYLLFKKYLRLYAVTLSNKLPASNSAPNKAPKTSERDEAVICMIINTADYCASSTGELGSSLKRIIAPKLLDAIDLKQEQNDFSTVIAKGVKALVMAVETKIEPWLLAMQKMPWATWESELEDQSEYVNGIASCLESSVPQINGRLTAAHFRFFCDSFVASFMPRLTSNIYKCRRISMSGAQHLLLDLTAVRSLLLALPLMGAGQAEPPAKGGRYGKYVDKEMEKANVLLKLMLTPQDKLLDSYKALCRPEHDDSDFQKVLELRGLKSDTQNVLLDAFHQAPSSSKPTVRIRKLLSDISDRVSVPTQKR